MPQPVAHHSLCAADRAPYSALQLADTLLSVLTARSALALLEAELLCEANRKAIPELEGWWHDARLPHSIDRVDVRSDFPTPARWGASPGG